MMCGMTMRLEMLPPRVPTKVVPGIRAFQANGSIMVFYAMGIHYASPLAQLKRFYQADTPAAAVADAVVPNRQRVVCSTVGRFQEEVKDHALPRDRHMLVVGKFLNVGRTRKDALAPPAMPSPH